MNSVREFSCKQALKKHLEKQRDLSLNKIKKYFDSDKETNSIEYAELIYIKNFYEDEIIKIKKEL
jgi:hypothetical protein